MITAIGSDGKTRTYKSTTSTEINQALGHGGTVTLEEGVTYTIKSPLLLPSNTILDGNGAKIKLDPKLPVWGGRDASISQKKAMLMIKGNYGKDVTVRKLTVDGSQSDYYPSVRLGTSCYNMATLIGCTGLNIEDCTFQNGCNDAILMTDCSFIDIERIRVNKCGHDGVYGYHISNIKVKDSVFINRTNSSIRLDTASNAEILNNNCTTSGGGYTGVELQGDLKNIFIQNNYIKGLPYPGIVSLTKKLNNVRIVENIIEKCKSPGISAPGAYLKNNTIK